MQILDIKKLGRQVQLMAEYNPDMHRELNRCMLKKKEGDGAIGMAPPFPFWGWWGRSLGTPWRSGRKVCGADGLYPYTLPREMLVF
jgi:hypothetical protein